MMIVRLIIVSSIQTCAPPDDEAADFAPAACHRGEKGEKYEETF
jgi:hypothetical protein